MESTFGAYLERTTTLLIQSHFVNGPLGGFHSRNGRVAASKRGVSAARSPDIAHDNLTDFLADLED